MGEKLPQQLRAVGSKLKDPPASKDELITLLEEAVSCLSEIEQSPLPSVLDSMKPFLKAIVKQELLQNQDSDIKVLVAVCICDVTRITAPDAPFTEDVLKEIFNLIVETFSELNDIHSSSFEKRVVILEKIARYQSCLVMLDLECDDLINEMFNTFFAVVSDDHPKNVLNAMQKIMVLILDESDDIQENLLSTILSPLGRERTDFSLTARRLAMDVIEKCAKKLEPCIKQLLVSSLSGRATCLNSPIDSHEVIYDIYQCAPQILSGLVPDIKGQLSSDVSDVRLKAVQLLGELFALPGISISESFQPIFSEFLNRSGDKVVEVRASVIEHLRNCVVSNPSRPEVPSVIKVLCDLLLDDNETVRQQAVNALHNAACHSLEVIKVETIIQVAKRLQDKSPSVKKYTMEKLADLYRFYCLKGAASVGELEWIPAKILRCLYDKDFRSEEIELLLCGFLFPPEFSTNDRLKHWTKVFSRFDKIEMKALEQILMQKQRLQQELQKYLSLRETNQEDDLEYQRKISVCFRVMSRFFSKPTKAEEGFQTLDQLKDTNIWKMLKSLLDPCTSFAQAWSFRDELLKILGEKHGLYDFVSKLSTKCSYLLLNKEYVKEILVQVSAQESAQDVKFIPSCMSLLAVIGTHSPILLSGFEENLVNLLKEDNDVVKEGIALVLAKAGGTIREQLATTSSSVDLLLERLCLEGSRKQAKYSVQGLAAITKDDGLKSLSVLYKRLVDMLLEEKTHVPAILQSLGCIAQIAMPVFETREEEIFDFIKHKILNVNNKTEGSSTNAGERKDRSEICMLKIFSIKTLVKSYLPVRDTHLRPGIEKIIEILKNILSFGDVSKDIKSSVVDKAHMKLASAKAILRLSRQWDHKIPLDVFYMALRVSEDIDAQSRKMFICKVHQYIEEHLLDAKYACAFLLNINQYPSPEYEEGEHKLLETIKICQGLKVGQGLIQSDGKSTAHYPEYILAYLVHSLAHHPSFPSIDECKDVKQFEPIYWRLHLFLSVLLHGDEGGPNFRENYTKIVSIFHSIKCSEDAFDKTKSEISHFISDFGLSIVKRLVKDQADNLEKANSLTLPPILYKATENKEGEKPLVNGEKPWLIGESILAHFESLGLEDQKMGNSDAHKDGMMLDDNDAKGLEVSLGKMMKHLKSKGSKKKRTPQKYNSTSDTNTPEKEDDILGVVREINLDMKIGENMELSELTKTNPISKDQLLSRNDGNEENSASQVKKETNGITFLTGPPTPKRKRSVSVQRSQSNITEGQSESKLLTYSSSNKKNLSPGNNLSIERVSESAVPDLVSHLPAIKNTSKKVIVAEKSSNNKKIGNSRSPTSASKKRKIISTAGLVKCSSHEIPLKNEELIGSRIKVWWPLDKEFYEGMIQSYDKGKKKHVILYDDGDIEVLNLDKEKWKFITDMDKPGKKSKLQHSSSNKEIPLEKNQEKKLSNSGQNRKSSWKDPRIPSKKHTKVNSKKTLERENGIGTEGESDSDLSDASSGGHNYGKNDESMQEDKPDTASSDSNDDSGDDKTS